MFGHDADDGRWSHPCADCGRDMVPVPPREGRDAKWRSTVDSRSASLVRGSDGADRAIVVFLGRQGAEQLSSTRSEANLSGARRGQTVPMLLGQNSEVPYGSCTGQGDQYSCEERLDTFSYSSFRGGSRRVSCSPREGWCCHWLREVLKQHKAGHVICCAVSNIYMPDAWAATTIQSQDIYKVGSQA